MLVGLTGRKFLLLNGRFHEAFGEIRGRAYDFMETEPQQAVRLAHVPDGGRCRAASGTRLPPARQYSHGEKTSLMHTTCWPTWKLMAVLEADR